jgi:hypothetical protein
LASVAKAKRFLEKFGVHEAHPDEFIAPAADEEARIWEDLLRKV